MKPHYAIKEHQPPFQAFWNGNRVTVTHAILTWDGKNRSQVTFSNGETKLVSTNRLKFSVKDLFPWDKAEV
jgi:hypothetical protein